MAEVQQQEGRREGDNGQLGGEASPSRHSDYHGVPLASPERPAGRLGEAPGGGKMASAAVQTGAPPPPRADRVGLEAGKLCAFPTLQAVVPASRNMPSIRADAATPALRTEQRAALSSAASTPRGGQGTSLLVCELQGLLRFQ